jgi:polyhydroxyalkanoate synthesis regulator phasin
MSTRTVKALWTLFSVTALMVVIAAFPVPALSQDKPADNMQILRDKVKADKKLLIATNMELTESEAKGFWPVYEGYQKKLTAINQRIGKLIESYAKDYDANTLTDEKAKKLTDELVAIGKAEAELQAASVPKLSKVLPPKKVARYLQIENKIRAVVKYELAKAVPLVE